MGNSGFWWMLSLFILVFLCLGYAIFGGGGRHQEYKGKEVWVKVPGSPIRATLIYSYSNWDKVIYQDQSGAIHTDEVPSFIVEPIQ